MQVTSLDQIHQNDVLYIAGLYSDWDMQRGRHIPVAALDIFVADYIEVDDRDSEWLHGHTGLSYVVYYGDGETEKKERQIDHGMKSLRDMGVTASYNDHKTFTTYEEAADYLDMMISNGGISFDVEYEVAFPTAVEEEGDHEFHPGLLKF